jgi:hypothetical protein
LQTSAATIRRKTLIPTIEQIVEDLLAGTISRRQAIGWLHQHAEGAANELRDMFACAALQGMLGNSYNDGVNKPLSVATNLDMAEMAYAQADAMLKRRSSCDAAGGEE